MTNRNEGTNIATRQSAAPATPLGSGVMIAPR